MKNDDKFKIEIYVPTKEPKKYPYRQEEEVKFNHVSGISPGKMDIQDYGEDVAQFDEGANADSFEIDEAREDLTPQIQRIITKADKEGELTMGESQALRSYEDFINELNTLVKNSPEFFRF